MTDSKQSDINRSHPNPGDHLKVRFGIYEHHGIYLEEDRVIHFGRGISDLANAKVEIVTTDLFCRGRDIVVVNSPVEFSPAEIVSRAMSRLHESDYDLFDNNCEHFVTWCRTGVSESRQIAQTETVARQTTAIISKPLVKQAVAKRIASATGGRVIVKFATRTSGVAIVGDATQAVAEWVAHSSGKSSADSKKIGLKTGAATSALLGLAVGGPVGSAGSLGLWLAGQWFADRAVDSSKRAFNELVQLTRPANA